MILLVGAHGFFGSVFKQELHNRGLDFNNVCRDGMKHGSFPLIPFATDMRQHGVSLVINCAAYVDPRGVDYNEYDREQTLQANLLLPTMLAHACEATDTPLLHLSTGCVYQGDNGGKGWTEDDPPHLNVNTCGIYVASKLMAEQVVRQWRKSWICRVRLPFDSIDHPRNLLTKLQRFDQVADETQSLTHRGDAVKAMLDMWQKGVAYGTYHLTSPGAVRYCDLCADLNVVLWNGKRRYNFISPAEFDATRALTVKSRCTLNTDKLANAGIRMRPVSEAIEDALTNWKTNVQAAHQMPNLP